MKSDRSSAIRFPAALAAGLLLAGAAHAAEMRVYKQPDFSGDQLTLRTTAPNLSVAGFQDQISSIEVRSGRWQLCTQPDFQGECVVIGRGDYPRLEKVLNHRIESVREITRYVRGRYGDDRSAYAYRGDFYADNGRRRDERAPYRY